AGVGGLVDAVAWHDVAANVRLTGPDVDHVGVGRGDGDRTDGRDRLVVEDRFPVQAAVTRFPDAAGGGGGVIGERIAGYAGRPGPPAAGRRSDVAELQAFEGLGPALGRVRVVGPDRAGTRQEDTDCPGKQGEERRSTRGGNAH